MTNRQLDMENIDRVDNLVYTPLERRYLQARIVGTVLAYAGLMVLPLFILLADDLKGRGTILACTESLLAVIAAVNLMLIPKACAFMGFALREHDITWRSGIIFPSVTTIPFCKIQQVSIRQNPVSRLFGLYSVHIVNGAQMMADTVIPGLAREKADEVKELLIERAKYESR